PHSVRPKSTVDGYPVTEPTAPWPFRVIEVTLVPQVTPATVTLVVAIAVAVPAGVKSKAVATGVPGLAAKGPAPVEPRENCGSVGVPNVTVARAFPTFTSESV